MGGGFHLREEVMKNNPKPAKVVCHTDVHTDCLSILENGYSDPVGFRKRLSAAFLVQS